MQKKLYKRIGSNDIGYIVRATQYTYQRKITQMYTDVHCMRKTKWKTAYVSAQERTAMQDIFRPKFHLVILYQAVQQYLVLTIARPLTVRTLIMTTSVLLMLRKREPRSFHIIIWLWVSHGPYRNTHFNKQIHFNLWFTQIIMRR